MDIANIIGMLGTLLVVAVYVLLQADKLDSKGLWFNVLNLVGAILLLFSLFVHYNLASVVIEVFWIGASIFGLYKYCRRQAQSDLD